MIEHPVRIYTYQEIADEMGISVTRVVQIEQRAMQKITDKLNKDPVLNDKWHFYMDKLKEKVNKS